MLPKISYIKGIDIFLLFCFIMTFLSVIQYGFVSYTHRCIERDKKRKEQLNKRKQDEKQIKIQNLNIIQKIKLESKIKRKKAYEKSNLKSFFGNIYNILLKL